VRLRKRRRRGSTAPRGSAQRQQAPGAPVQSALRDLALAHIFASVVVVELVDDAASTQRAPGVARTWIDVDIDDHGRAVAGKDGFGRPGSGEAAPTAPTPAAADEKLISAMAVEPVEAEAIKPVRAEMTEAEAAHFKSLVEPVGREVWGTANSRTRPSA
jgi:hypothetical protein